MNRSIIAFLLFATSAFAAGRAEDDRAISAIRASSVKTPGERVVVWAPASWPEAKRAEITATLDRYVRSVQNVLRRPYDRTIEYFITASDDIPSHVYGAYDHDPSRDHPYVFLSGLDSGEAPHIHETAHIVGGRFGSLLLREGVATYVQFTLEPGKKMRPLVKLGATDLETLDAAVAQLLAKPQSRELALRWLANPVKRVDFTSRPERAVFYAVGASVTAFLVERLGMETFMKAYAADDPRSVIPSWQTLTEEWLRGRT